MSNQITTAFVKQFEGNIDILSQQLGSVLEGAVRNETVIGEHGFYDQVSATAAVQRTTRHGDTPLIHTPHARRRVTLVDYDWADLVDNLDRVKMLISPDSTYAKNAAMAMGRAKDSAIISAALGTAYTGVDGGTSTSFDSNNVVAVNEGGAGNTGLTIVKLLAAKRVLDAGNVDSRIPRYIAVSARQLEDLLGTTQVTSVDYNSVKSLVNGEIDTFLGFKFIHTELLATDTNDYRRVIAWAQDGLLLGTGGGENGMSARIEERADKNYATQVYLTMSIGATRMEEAKVVEIKCNEA